MTNIMRFVILAGSRSLSLTVEQIDHDIRLLDPGGYVWRSEDWAEVVCGMAQGMDESGRLWAIAKGKAVHEEPITAADVKRWGKYLAPKARNHRMGLRAQGALIWWDRRSGGSADMAARMLLLRKPVHIFDRGP